MHEYALRAEGLVKRFGRTTALNGVDLTAHTGTVLGVLGPNGAGKTTLIRILATLARPDAGTAFVGGYDVVHQAAQVRRLIGMTGQKSTIDEELTGAANLVLLGRLLDLPRKQARARADELLDRFGLADVANRPTATYSGGTRRRLDLAASLVGRPQVVFLDEPSTGLDPGRREELWGMIRELTTQERTVLLTTQYLEEADALADRIAVVDQGRVIADGAPTELKELVGGRTFSVRPTDPDRCGEIADVLARATGRRPERAHNHTLAVPVDNDHTAYALLHALREKDLPVMEFSLHLPSLDEAFLALTGTSGNTGKETAA